LSQTGVATPEIWATLVEAIDERREVELEYEREGSAKGARRAEPHAMFRGGEGRVFLYAMQISGVSNRKELPGWRRFALESIKGAMALESDFTVSDDYDPASRVFREGLIKSVS
jgi:hypothetical protein